MAWNILDKGTVKLSDSTGHGNAMPETQSRWAAYVVIMKQQATRRYRPPPTSAVDLMFLRADCVEKWRRARQSI